MKYATYSAVSLSILALLAACGGEGDPLGPAGAELELAATGLGALDPAREGVYQAWVVDRAGTPHSAGRFASLATPVRLSNPVADAAAFLVTLEGPDDADPGPSAQVLLRGDASSDGADLSVRGALTAANLPLQENPGQYTVFTPSDNHKNPYPSNENSGVWLLNSTVISQGLDQWVRLAPLKPGWVYEGWMVRDPGTAGEVWMSYGKFTPSNDGTVNRRDDNGWGPFSGAIDYVTDGLEDYPGDDWVENPFGFPVPGDLPLPIDFRETGPDGQIRWWHLITIEPETDLARKEAVSSERPFLLRPYRDRFVDNGVGRGRRITFHADAVPSARVRVVR